MCWCNHQPEEPVDVVVNFVTCVVSRMLSSAKVRPGATWQRTALMIAARHGRRAYSSFGENERERERDFRDFQPRQDGRKS